MKEVISLEAIIKQQERLKEVNFIVQELIDDSLSKYELEKLYQIQKLIYNSMLSDQTISRIEGACNE